MFCGSFPMENIISEEEIINEEEISLSIAKTINDAEEDAGFKINSAYVTIPGKYVTIVQNSIVKEVKVLTPDLNIVTMSNSELNYSYRDSFLKKIKNIFALKQH